MSVTRYLYKFTSIDEATVFEFPRNHLSQRISQELAAPTAKIIGQSYGVRLNGAVPGVKGIATAEVRFFLVSHDADYLDARRDEIEEICYELGLGYLHYSDGRKAQASLTTMPEIEIDWEQPHILPIVLEFDVFEDFA